MYVSIGEDSAKCQLSDSALSQVVKRYMGEGEVVVRNAVIQKVLIGLDGGSLTVYVELSCGGCGQSFGGETYTEGLAEDCTGVLISGLLRVTGESALHDVVGHAVRAIIAGRWVVALAHIVDDNCVFDKQEEIGEYFAQVANGRKLSRELRGVEGTHTV